MPPITYPNQRVVTIHREQATAPFLGINNENWMAAARNLSAHALKLYLYLASNKDDYNLALSPAAIQAEIDMARSTYHDQFRVLINKGYLVYREGNRYDFYETPWGNENPKSGASYITNQTVIEPNDGQEKPADGNIVLGEDIEINNT